MRRTYATATASSSSPNRPASSVATMPTPSPQLREGVARVRPTMSRLQIAALLTALALAPHAYAQTDQFALDRRHAANQLGLLQYCQAQGHTGADAITAERNVMARLPPIPADAPYTRYITDAEADGRDGTIVPEHGAPLALARLPSTMADTLCKQMASTAIAAAGVHRPADRHPSHARRGMRLRRGRLVPTSRSGTESHQKQAIRALAH